MNAPTPDVRLYAAAPALLAALKALIPWAEALQGEATSEMEFQLIGGQIDAARVAIEQAEGCKKN